MKFWVIFISMLVLLSGCASKTGLENVCGTVANYRIPNSDDGVYRVVVTHINGKPVVSLPSYKLPLGEYRFTVAELIDSPRLHVKLSARQTKTLTIKIKANQRYHLGAKFNQDKIYRGVDTDYWQPIVWDEDSYQCEIIASENE